MRPMLAKTGSKEILGSEKYFFEPKLDGTRAILYKDGEKLKLVNRRDKQIQHRFPELLGITNAIKCGRAVLDGEIVVYNSKGLPDFNLIQKRAVDNPLRIKHLSKSIPAKYVVFDILEKDGEDLTRLKLVERKKILEATIGKHPRLQLVYHTEQGEKLWRTIEKMGLEGIIAKEKESRYQSGVRSWAWLKIKRTNTIDCVVVGILQGKGKREKLFGSLCLGLYDKTGKLWYAGRAGSGFTDQELQNIHKLIKPLLTKHPTVVNPPENGSITWAKPLLVCEVKYLELTRNNQLRNPVFQRLREDKPPTECTF